MRLEDLRVFASDMRDEGRTAYEDGFNWAVQQIEQCRAEHRAVERIKNAGNAMAAVLRKAINKCSVYEGIPEIDAIRAILLEGVLDGE